MEWIPFRDMPPFLRNGKISTRDINKQVEDFYNIFHLLNPKQTDSLVLPPLLS